MEIDPKLVVDLRARTGLGMMACKKALAAEAGDIERAFDRLRREGLKRAEGKAGRATGEGRVVARGSADGRRGTMLEVDCESEPVSHTPLFREFVDRLLAFVDDRAPADLDALLAAPFEGGETVQQALQGLIAKIGENMRIRGFRRYAVKGDGVVGHYVHHGEKKGAIVSLEGPGDRKALADLAKEVSMHVVFARPTALSRDEIPAEARTRELDILRDQLKQDPKMAKKPESVLAGILEGKLRTFYEQSVLPEQPWFRDGAKRVSDMLAAERATVKAFGLFEVGG
jgi:elongation factor Ts